MELREALFLGGPMNMSKTMVIPGKNYGGGLCLYTERHIDDVPFLIMAPSHYSDDDVRQSLARFVAKELTKNHGG